MKITVQIKTNSITRDEMTPNSIPAIAPIVLGNNTAKLAIHSGKLIQ